MWPSFTGARNTSESTDAVTTFVRLCRVEALAALFLAAGPGTAATTPRPAAPGEAARSRFLMGTRLAIEVEGGAPEEAFEDAFDEVSRLETILSNWRETSEI